MVMRGEDAAGIERIRDAIAEWQAMGIAIGMGAYAVVLANACLAAARRRLAGDDAAGGSLLATGLTAIEPVIGPVKVSCGQSYEAELHRVRGELLLARDGLDAAEEALACFGRALALAREKGALGWELRVAMSIVRLRKRQGEGRPAELAEARNCLAEVYGRFTEGFDFPDLRDAARLLGEAGCRAVHNPASKAES
jgi:hypothetical protein